MAQQKNETMKTGNKSGQNYLKPVLGIFCLVLIYIQFSTDFLILDLWLKLLVVSCILFFVPGYFLYTMFFPKEKHDIMLALPLYSMFSFILFTPLGFLAYVIRLRLDMLVSSFILLSFVVAVINIYRSYYGFGNTVEVQVKQDKKKQKQTNGSLGIDKLLLFAILIVSFFAAKYFGSWPSGDFITHLTAIRKLLELPEIIFTNYHIRELTISPYGHDIWYLFYSLITRVAHIDPFETWALMSMVLTPLRIMAFYLFADKLFQNKKIAFFSTLVFVFNSGIMNNNITEGTMAPYWELSGVAPYPSRIALFLVLPVLLYFIFSYLHTDDKKYLYTIPFCSLVLVLTHFYYFLCILFVCGSFLVMSFIVRSEDKKLTLKIAQVMGCIFIPSGFYLIWFVSRVFPTINPLFKGLLHGHYLPIIMIKDKYPIVNPLTGLCQNAVRWAAYICVPFLLFFAKKNKWALFAFSVSAMVAFIFFNPLALYVLEKFNPSLDRIYRLDEIVPYEVVLGFFVYYFYTVIIKKINSKLLRETIVLASIAGVVFISIKDIEKLSDITFTADSTLQMLESNRGFMKEVNSIIPVGSTVFMDDGKIWYWSDFFPHYNVSHPNIAVLPNNFDATQRRADSVYFFKSPLEKRSFDILNEYKVDYVIIDKKYADNKDLVKYGDLLKPVLKLQGFTIYKFNGDWNKPSILNR